MKDDKSLKKEISNMAIKAIIISTLIMIVVSVIADTGLIENPILKVVVLGIIMILSFSMVCFQIDHMIQKPFGRMGNQFSK